MKRFVLCAVLAGCGVEKGGTTTSLPVQPSAESVQKKKYAIDPLGFSTGRFTFASTMTSGVTAVDANGNTYILFYYYFGYDDAVKRVMQAIKFGPDGKVVNGFDPFGNYEQVHGEFLHNPQALTANAEGKLFLLADTKDSADISAKTTGTAVISFTADGYLNSGFGSSGVVRSTETGYTDIQVSNQYVYVGGDAIRRLAVTDGASDKPYGKSGDLAATSFGSFLVSAADVLVNISSRYDATGVKTGTIDVPGLAAGYDPQQNGFLFYSSSGQEMSLAAEDGTKVESFGTGGTTALPWLAELSYPEFSIVNGRVLAAVSFGTGAGYSVFSSAGTQIAGFGTGGSGICKTGENYSRLLLLPTGNVLIIDRDEGEETGGRIRHVGADCQEVSVN
jgi:hypothetical protein